MSDVWAIAILSLELTEIFVSKQCRPCSDASGSSTLYIHFNGTVVLYGLNHRSFDRQLDFLFCELGFGSNYINFL